jgi:phenylpyruvate tautomerase PptA (4-oxalocrotonate tautomerase family)
MPTYICSTAANRLTSEQRAKIAQAITTVHSEEALAPRYLVQVIFKEVGTSENYIGGKPAPTSHIWIRADIRAGRTELQRTTLQLRMAREVSEIAGSSLDNIWIYLNELLPTNMVEFGQLLPQPGEETQWFHGLPGALQERLSTLEKP